MLTHNDHFLGGRVKNFEVKKFQIKISTSIRAMFVYLSISLRK